MSMKAAGINYYPFQVVSRLVLNRPGEVYYIGGNDVLPAPLEPSQEAGVLEQLGTERKKRQKQY